MFSKPLMKKMLVTGLAAAMLISGGSSAFADGKGKDKGNGSGHNKKYETQKIKFEGNINIIVNFSDVSGADVEWAAKYIASLASKQVFEGYEDGTFQPRKPITRIEAITAAVRLMGLRAKAESSAEINSNLNFKDADKIRKQYPWATGYVAVAAENDLFLESDDSVQPEKPADRLWATTLLVKALKLTAEAKASMNDKLTFKDAKDIPAGSVGYVAVAIKKGLIDGYEDNTFRPNRPVTRAELAALLDRTGEQLPDNGGGQNQSATITGVLTADVGSDKVLKIRRNGQVVSVTADTNTFVYRDGEKASLSDLEAGDTVKVRTFNNIAVFVEVTKLAEEDDAFTVRGVYKDMTLTADGKIATIKIKQTNGSTVQETVYKVASDVAISGGTLPAPNKELELKGTGSFVTHIKILD